MREEIHEHEAPPAEPHAAIESEENEGEQKVEDVDAVDSDKRNSIILRINPILRPNLHKEINDTTVLRKSYSSKDCEITDLEVSNSNTKANPM